MSHLLCLNTELLHHVGSLTESCCEMYLLLSDRVDVTKQAVIRSRDLHSSHIGVPCLSTSFINSFKYNQQDITLYNIFYCCQCSTCFRRFCPSSGVQNCTRSFWYMSSLLAATASVGELARSFELLMMVGRTAWSMYSIDSNKKYCTCITLHLVGYT
jgi:hypothetical protein